MDTRVPTRTQKDKEFLRSAHQLRTDMRRVLGRWFGSVSRHLELNFQRDS